MFSKLRDPPPHPHPSPTPPPPLNHNPLITLTEICIMTTLTCDIHESPDKLRAQTARGATLAKDEFLATILPIFSFKNGKISTFYISIYSLSKFSTI